VDCKKGGQGSVGIGKTGHVQFGLKGNRKTANFQKVKQKNAEGGVLKVSSEWGGAEKRMSRSQFVQ